ncbi:flavin-containing monooxygenase [Hoyosella altamirensis]|uniref:Cation diffusion facilitator CzcD-associated flavoprotein CzcO n=1 Tax=Hoyosella altamirensis TaxID=616997 RepID=A0A839RTV3_9ACTN|nr:NAD(P)/FAD-dependent oxidoreductase [Hoyosella altamirensis]MBB3039241.1 cation diffusion facilitator CzcD-associated flavoprotein CzcO [Hoyosella altamirensis]
MRKHRDGVYDVLVVGAGVAGLYAIHTARQTQLNVVCLEAGDGVGGTWYYNRYPGCRCDVESIDYSYSFDEELQREWRWSERYATQPEILSYLNHVAQRFDLLPHIRFGERVEQARFDEHRSAWIVQASSGREYRARNIIFATGSLSTPNIPAIPGAEHFTGDVYRTAQWPDSTPSFAGKRVAVIGTGSSGIQAIPVVAREAKSLTVFQRTANYSVPAFNRTLTNDDYERIVREYPERRRTSRMSGGGSPHQAHPHNATDVTAEERRAAFEATWRTGGVLFSKTFPDQNIDHTANKYAREFFEEKIRDIVRDPRTRDDLIPSDHPIGAKRICTDSGYYETFNRDNVTLVNLRHEPIEAITARGILTSAAQYEFDVIIYATGFDALTGTLQRIDIQGAAGMRLGDVWRNGPLTYLGMQIPGFPNMFIVNGPGSPAVLANMILTSEQQVSWIIDLIAHCSVIGVQQAEPRRDAAEKWTEHVTELANGTLLPLANSWYVGANIPGKPRTFMLYCGGLGTYTTICDDVKAAGYEGLVMTSRSQQWAS